jgi:hypothetical protein
MILEDYIEPGSYDAAFWMAGVYDDEFPFEELGDLTIELSSKLRTMAVSVLVSTGKSNAFYHNLMRSGRVRERYLRRCLTEAHLDDHHRCSGRYAPFLDAIAGGDEHLAVRIADLSPSEWLTGHEYEDDYCYAQILHSLVKGEAARHEDLLAQFERYLEGEPSLRFRLARALVSRSQQDFDDAFEDLLRQRTNEIAANKARGELEEPHVIAGRRIFVEGLAILRLAEKVGLKTEEEYLFCPSIARIPMTEPFPGE